MERRENASQEAFSKAIRGDLAYAPDVSITEIESSWELMLSIRV
jgi:hypothetical protein